MDDDRDAAAAGGGAKEAIETVKTLIRKECYKEASEWIKMAMELYPAADFLKEDGFGTLVIAETLHYGDIHLSKCNGFDCYSILHLPPSSTQAEVEKCFNEIKKEVINLIKIGFPGAKLAEILLKLANTALWQNSLRSIFDSPRKECVFFDWPTKPSNNTSSSSFRESYLDWKPPIYRVDVTEHVQIWKKLKLDHLSPCPHQPEKEKEKNPYLSPEMRILKRKVFDEMPQNPNYTPLDKYQWKCSSRYTLWRMLEFKKKRLKRVL